MHEQTSRAPHRIPVAAPRTSPPRGPAGDPGFEAFASEQQQVMRDYIERRLGGVEGVSGEDALQDALVRIWRQWERWPTDPDQRQAYMRQALKVAAVDAIRARHGRGERKVREISVNFAELDTHTLAETSGEHLARELGRVMARDSLERQHDRDGRTDRGVLVAAFAALEDQERRILALTAAGHDGKQIATQLGLRHQHVREKLMRARRLLRSLIEHADGGTVRPQEIRQLWAYRDNELTGKPRREVRRHLEHCATCQRLLAQERRVTDHTVTAFLPLPPIAAITSWLTGTHASGNAGTAGLSEVATTAVPGGSVFGPGGVLAGVTAKTAVALGAGAVAFSAAGVTKLYVDRTRTTHPATTAVAASPQHIPPERPRTIATRPSTAAAPRAPRPKRPAADRAAVAPVRPFAPVASSAARGVASAPAPRTVRERAPVAVEVFAMGSASPQDADTLGSATTTQRP